MTKISQFYALIFSLAIQEKEEQAERDKQRDKAKAAEGKCLEEEASMREEKRKQRELQEIEKKQALEKIAALKKTTVGARALKNLTEQVQFETTVWGWTLKNEVLVMK